MNDTFASAVRARLKELGLKPFAAEKNAGLSEDAIRSVLRPERKVGPTLKRTQEICDALGMELYFGPPRTDAGPLESEDFVMVRRFDVELSAGPGSEASNAPELASVAFRADWMSAAGLIADKCYVVSIRSQSMEPLLGEGDLVLVNGQRTTPIQNSKVYAFVDINGDLRVKRLEQLDHELVLRSDNPDYPTEIRSPADTKQIKVLGQIAWSSRTWGR